MLHRKMFISGNLCVVNSQSSSKKAALAIFFDNSKSSFYIPNGMRALITSGLDKEPGDYVKILVNKEIVSVHYTELSLI